MPKIDLDDLFSGPAPTVKAASGSKSQKAPLPTVVHSDFGVTLTLGHATVELTPKEATVLARQIREAATVARRRRPMKPELGKKYLMVFGGKWDQILIIRFPEPGPRWEDILSALRKALRQHGTALYGKQLDSLYDPRDEQASDGDLARLEAAFAGDKQVWKKVWCYDWKDGEFVLVRPPAAKYIQSSYLAD
jgi:hypothetical protein